jgi:calcium-dependent protein kinase
VLEAVKKGKYRLVGTKWDSVSEDAKNFIRALLVFSPKNRMSAADALQHPFLADAKRAVERKPLPAEVLRGLRLFAHTRRWKRAALEAVAFSLPDEHEFSHLRDAFIKFDAHGTGFVQLDDFSAALAPLGVSATEAAELFNAAAAGHACGLAYTEFLAATLPSRLVSREVLEAAFTALDIDNAGFLTADSLRKLYGHDAAAFDDFGSLIAAGQDGRVDFPTFYASFVSPEDDAGSARHGRVELREPRATS